MIKVFGAAVQGIDALVVTIEVNCTQGIRFFLVGLPDAAVKESHERIVSAVQHNGYKFPRRQIVINMAPLPIFGKRVLRMICRWLSVFWLLPN